MRATKSFKSIITTLSAALIALGVFHPQGLFADPVTGPLTPQLTCLGFLSGYIDSKGAPNILRSCIWTKGGAPVNVCALEDDKHSGNFYIFSDTSTDFYDNSVLQFSKNPLDPDALPKYFEYDLNGLKYAVTASWGHDLSPGGHPWHEVDIQAVKNPNAFANAPGTVTLLKEHQVLSDKDSTRVLNTALSSYFTNFQDQEKKNIAEAIRRNKSASEEWLSVRDKLVSKCSGIASIGPALSKYLKDTNTSTETPSGASEERLH